MQRTQDAIREAEEIVAKTGLRTSESISVLFAEPESIIATENRPMGRPIRSFWARMVAGHSNGCCWAASLREWRCTSVVPSKLARPQIAAQSRQRRKSRFPRWRKATGRQERQDDSFATERDCAPGRP